METQALLKFCLYLAIKFSTGIKMGGIGFWSYIKKGKSPQIYNYEYAANGNMFWTLSAFVNQ